MATITVDVKAVDYTENVDKVLKKYRKTAEVPGFRKGKTPMGIINKKYRTGVLIEEVNKLIQDKLYKNVKERKSIRDVQKLYNFFRYKNQIRPIRI